MPPRVKITKEMIIETTFNSVRESGAEVLNARAIAKEIGCSTQPIFSNFSSLDELRFHIFEKAHELYRSYIELEIDGKEYPKYKAMGMAYIKFAKYEKELFKLLFMRDRRENDIFNQDADFSDISDFIKCNLGFSDKKSDLFHLEMWSYVHGIAVMSATNYLELDIKLISNMLTDAYLGIQNRFKETE